MLFYSLVKVMMDDGRKEHLEQGGRSQVIVSAVPPSGRWPDQRREFTISVRWQAKHPPASEVERENGGHGHEHFIPCTS